MSRNECETWLCTLESGDWGYVSEKECVLNITDIVTVTCLKMDVTSLNKLQSQLWLYCDGMEMATPKSFWLFKKEVYLQFFQAQAQS